MRVCQFRHTGLNHYIPKNGLPWQGEPPRFLGCQALSSWSSVSRWTRTRSIRRRVASTT